MQIFLTLYDTFLTFQFVCKRQSEVGHWKPLYKSKTNFNSEKNCKAIKPSHGISYQPIQNSTHPPAYLATLATPNEIFLAAGMGGNPYLELRL